MRASVATLFCISLASACASSSTPEDRDPADATPTAAVPSTSTGEAPATTLELGVRLTDHLSLGEAIHVGALTVWPVLTDAPQSMGEFATLTDAQNRRRAEVRECGVDAEGLSFGQRFRERLAMNSARDADVATSGGSQVNQLVVDNAGDVPLFVPAGTLVRGGDQDRFIAEDLVVPPDRAAIARVYCVEPGRWSNLRGGRPTEGRFEAAECVAVTNVRTAGQYEGSQGGVWNNVAAVNRSTGAVGDVAGASAGGLGSLFASVDDARDGARQDRAAVVEAVVRHFESPAAPGDRTVGFAYAVSGVPVAVHAFAGPDLFRPRFPAYVQSMAMESAMAKKGTASGARLARPEDVVTLVRSIEKGGERAVEDRGSHRLVNRRSNAGWSCACVVTVDGLDTVLSEDWTAR